MMYQIIAVWSLYISLINGLIPSDAVVRGPIGCGDTVYGSVSGGGFECFEYTPVSTDECTVAVDTCLPESTLTPAGLF